MALASFASVVTATDSEDLIQSILEPRNLRVCIGVPASSSDFLSAPLFLISVCDVPSLRSDHGARTADCHSSGEPRPRTQHLFDTNGFVPFRHPLRTRK